MESPCPALFPNAKFVDGDFDRCLSDAECEKECDAECDDDGARYHIFNHFDGSGKKLIPECRPNSAAKDQPGFTCGFDPMLKTGSRVIIAGIPRNQHLRKDTRKIRLLGKDHYDDMRVDLDTLENDSCKNDSSVLRCPTINTFSMSDCGPQGDPIDGVSQMIVFENPFSTHEFPGCEPNVITTNVTNGWIEERQIYIGYDDLVISNSKLGDVKFDIHKVYELSCKIEKHGSVDTDFEVKIEAKNVNEEETLDTKFQIETYYDDITKPIRPTEKLNEVIKLSPNADPNYLIQFKVTSNHDTEYVHLKQCSLFHNGEKVDFINDGCVGENWNGLFNNKKRKKTEQNEDWFSMLPSVMTDDCKTQWHIDCTVISCSRDYITEVCEAGKNCAERYSDSFLRPIGRKRRSLADPTETHVEADFFHPCRFVDQNTPEYCFRRDDEDICWTLEICAETFPKNFPNFQTPGLDSILTRHKFEVENYIERLLGSRKLQIDEQKIQDIVTKAENVNDAVSEIDGAVSEMVESIRSLEDEIMDE